MVSGFFTSPCDQSRIFWGAASLIRIASNVMGFACRSRMPQRSLVGLSSLIRLPKGRSVSIRYSPLGSLLPLSGSLLPVHEVSQLEDVDLADGDFLVEPPAGAPIVEDGLARRRQARLLQVRLDLLLGRAVEHGARHPHAERARGPSQMGLEDLTDVH